VVRPITLARIRRFVADTVPRLSEQQIVGVQDMMYMSSTSTMNGSLYLVMHIYNKGSDQLG